MCYFMHLIVFTKTCYSLFYCSKTALLEGLEVDQYMLGILIYIQKYVSVN